MNKKLLWIAFLLILLKILLLLFIPVPLGFSDSLTHLEGAKEFFNNPSFISATSTQKYVFFPVLISPLFFLKDLTLIFFFSLVFNAILSSFVVFPLYLLAKEFLEEKESILVAAVVAVLPVLFISSFYLLSEALFFFLCIFSVFFLFKAYTEEKKLGDILGGLSIAAVLLTKVAGIIFLPLLFFLFLRAIKNKQWTLVRNKVFLLISGGFLLLPFFIAKGLRNGFTLVGILGYSSEVSKVVQAMNIPLKILWFAFYTDYVLLAGGIICFCIFIYACLNYKKKNEKEKILLQLTLWILLGALVLAANNASYFSQIEDTRIIGRYVEWGISFLILTSVIFIRDWKVKFDALKIIILFFIAFTTPFILTKALFPLNNAGLAYLGVIQILFQYLHIPIWLVTIPLLFGAFLLLRVKKLKVKKILYILFVSFFILCLLNVTMIIYDVNKNWASLEEVKLGEWINKNLEKEATFLIDENDMPEIDYRDKPLKVFEIKDRPITVIAYWIYGNYDVTNVSHAESYDYIISTQNLPYEIVHEVGEIKIYDVV